MNLNPQHEMWQALGTATTLAVEAAEQIRRQRPARVQVQDTKSSGTDVVTAMDTAIEAFLRQELAQRCPQDGVLGEELSDTDSRSGRSWVLDPIDGTVNYLYGLDNYSVSVGLVSGNPRMPGAWEPIAGAVASAAMGKVFLGGPGLGAWEMSWSVAQKVVSGASDAWSVAGLHDMGAQPLVPGSTVELSQALVATGFGYQKQRRASQARVLQTVLPAVRDIRRMGSAALDMCAVAAGYVDAYYERGVQIWDVAAATAICRAAGVEVLGLRSQPASNEMTVVTSEALAVKLQEILQECDADSDEIDHQK